MFQMKLFSRNPISLRGREAPYIPISLLNENILSIHIIFLTEQFAGNCEDGLRFNNLLKHLLTTRMARFPDMDNSKKRQKLN